MEVGRPTKYEEEYINKVDDYLAENQDEFENNKLKVKLPTVEGFAMYIGVNKTTLYEWEKRYENFSNALEKIRVEQKKRLLNSGLSGEYNSTIAKLILSSNHGMSDKQDVDVKSGGEVIKAINYIIPDGDNTEANTETTFSVPSTE